MEGEPPRPVGLPARWAETNFPRVSNLPCAWQGERIARHNCLRDLLHSTAAAAALAPAKEGRFLLPGEGGRPADILIPGWSNGRDAALDVTVTVRVMRALTDSDYGVLTGARPC